MSKLILESIGFMGLESCILGVIVKDHWHLTGEALRTTLQKIRVFCQASKSRKLIFTLARDKHYSLLLFVKFVKLIIMLSLKKEKD